MPSISGRSPRESLDRGASRFLFPALLALIAGCSEPDPLGRVEVTGEVIVDGRPLDAGAIMLEPGPSGPPTAVGSTIRAGAFTIARPEGPAPGSYRVRIYASSREQAPPPRGASDKKPRSMIEKIPEDYNAKSTRMIEIRADEPNHLRFDIATGAVPR
ncbi:hypothetical protein [Paludisphaera soli]|uniref:hypothetical protein n=1 Tax=Paludisphaera soli TaxID=2712865 RepID=UPI0013ED2350|nr:hypothetical protein [Paludisphaera soli]